MKTLVSALSIFVLLFSLACNQTKTTETNTTTNESEVATVTYKVEGMTCEGCENTVCKSVETIEGIKEIKASHTEGTATVVFDKSKTNAEAIKAAITEKYEVSAIVSQQ